MQGATTGSRGTGAFGGAALLALVLTGASCGGGTASPDGGGAAGAGGGNEVAQCKQVVATYCKRGKECNAPDAGADAEAMCVTAINVAFGCDRAPAIPVMQDGGTPVLWSDCLNDLKNISCVSFSASLPASCNTLVGDIPLSTAQEKCGELAGGVCQWLAACQRITLSPSQMQSCESDLFANLDCLFAIDVGANYAQCLQDVPNTPCAAGPDGGVTGPDGGDLQPPACLDTAITYVQ